MDAALQKETESKRVANLASSCAAILASLLTHENEQELKSEERKMISEIKPAITQ